MEHSSSIQLDDLSDEILLIILKKLDTCDVLYCLKAVNKRLDTIVNDSVFTGNLTLISSVNKRFDTIFTRNSALITPFDGLSCQFTDRIFDRFCLDILPKINEKIERLTVDHRLWNVFFLQQIILIYIHLVYTILHQKRLVISLTVRYFFYSFND
jgi:hypothetical protein